MARKGDPLEGERGNRPRRINVNFQPKSAVGRSVWLAEREPEDTAWSENGGSVKDDKDLSRNIYVLYGYFHYIILIN